MNTKLPGSFFKALIKVGSCLYLICFKRNNARGTMKSFELILVDDCCDEVSVGEWFDGKLF